MTIRNLRAMPWIGEDPVLDLANTVICGAGPTHADIDLFADAELTASWRARATERRLALLPLEDLTVLRDLTRAALDASAGQRALPESVRTELNELASAAPVTFLVTADGRLDQRDTGGPAQAAAARQALLLAAGPEQARLRRCHAPSCGMFFLARRRDQAWCSLGCGNRARSARRKPQAPA
ncbi:CGNR zinc finger domain-containing protein [Streptomyces sp. TBY4]|uniref:CGNR zinc finger domain-containing protein n=1 Tax=Streptomyces sp. TBY4 TaxID=2962030 RepID=UPI0020B7F5E9|nr:CGNR zinc finger domain-containing protein [Streptomyces sp. TBY4]MCP3757235.1 CGNR zinc finger domain-containing protein [Streptomyces sp. TBY4]